MSTWAGLPFVVGRAEIPPSTENLDNPMMPNSHENRKRAKGERWISWE